MTIEEFVAEIDKLSVLELGGFVQIIVLLRYLNLVIDVFDLLSEL